MIHLVQHLCPERHCLMAAGFVAGSATPEQVARMILDREAELGYEARCWLCGSTELRFEEARTRFPDMETAMPVLRQAEEANRSTREFVERLRKVGVWHF